MFCNYSESLIKIFSVRCFLKRKMYYKISTLKIFLKIEIYRIYEN